MKRLVISTTPSSWAPTQEVRNAVGHQQRITWVIDQRREPGDNADLTLDSADQKHAAVGGDAATIERSGGFRVPQRW